DVLSFESNQRINCYVPATVTSSNPTHDPIWMFIAEILELFQDANYLAFRLCRIYSKFGDGHTCNVGALVKMTANLHEDSFFATIYAAKFANPFSGLIAHAD